MVAMTMKMIPFIARKDNEKSVREIWVRNDMQNITEYFFGLFLFRTILD